MAVRASASLRARSLPVSLTAGVSHEVRIPGRSGRDATIGLARRSPMTEIVCIADLHEHLVDVPACDVLLIAGDVSFAVKGDLRAKHAFLVGPFREWLER